MSIRHLFVAVAGIAALSVAACSPAEETKTEDAMAPADGAMAPAADGAMAADGAVAAEGAAAADGAMALAADGAMAADDKMAPAADKMAPGQ